jgi:WD repeat-containing protein 19
MALGNFTQAASTAAIIARQEQELGNYKQAHVVLFETIQHLEEHEVPKGNARRRVAASAPKR